MSRFVSIIIILLSVSNVQAQTANWTSVGPIQFPTNVSGQINGIGRTTQIKFHPYKSDVIFATTASGGLYRSDDLGNHWQVLGTDSMPHCQLASVCIDHTDDQIIYLGTGDPNYYSTSFGIWKSTDGGVNFTQLNGVGNRMALEMIMRPSDHDQIVAVTNDGIFKTEDGGGVWTEIMNSGTFTDMKLMPGSDSVLYAVTKSEFFRSSDFGSSWSQITNGIAVPGGGDGKGMRLAVSSANPMVVYAGMIKDEGTIFRSNDAGLSFTTVYHNTAQSLVGYDENGGGQGNYNFGMVADPTDEDVVYTVSHVIWKSINGGVDWTKLTDWWAVVHTDMHGMAFSPYYTDMMFNINDGGIWLSEDGGSSWSIKSDGLEATEAVHTSASLTQPDIISIGTQDNGELYHKGDGWFTNRGGDWYVKMSFDYTPNGFVYYHSQNSRRNPVLGGSQSIGLPDIEVSDNCKFAFTSVNPDLAFAGLTHLYRTNNLSDPTPQWDSIFGEGYQIKDVAIYQRDPNILAVVTLNGKIYKSLKALDAQPEFTQITLPSGSAAIAHIALDVHNHEVMYVTLGSRVWRTSNNGVDWENVSGSLAPVNIINMVLDSARTDESVYIATALGVYYRNKNMNDWVNFSHGLPTIANIQDFMIYDDLSIGRRLRVGYYGRGVFEAPLFTENTCQLPTDITVDLDGIGAAVHWQGADSVKMQYRNVKSSKWITSVESNSHALIRWLEHCQTYEVRAARICANENSFYSLPTQFTVEGKSLSKEWFTGDIGSHTFQGYYCFNPENQEVYITSAGEDIWNTADKFYYISQPMSGDGEITARITQVERSHGWAKAGLMIRASRSEISAHVMLCITPDNGAAMQWRSGTLGATDNYNLEGIGMPYWLKLGRQGDVITGYISSDGSSWEVLYYVNMTFLQDPVIGVFSCSHVGNLENTAVMDHVSMFPLVTGSETIDDDKTSLSIFPNPTDGNLHLICESSMRSFDIIDMSGRMVKSVNLNDVNFTDVELKDVASGIYMAQVTFSDGSRHLKKFEKR